MGCSSEKDFLSFGQWKKGLFLEEHLVWGHPFQNLFPIFYCCRRHEACFRYVMLRSGLMMGDYYYFLIGKKQYIDKKRALGSQRVH